MMKEMLWLGLDPEELSAEQRNTIAECAGKLDLDPCYVSEKADIESQNVSRVSVAIGQFPRSRLGDAERLRWYQQFATGIEWLMEFPEARKRDFILTNVSDVHYIALAEHAILGWLAWARWLPQAFQVQAAHKWQRPEWDEKDVFELAGSTLLLAGVGAIGKHAAKIAKGFGANVIGLKRTMEALPFVDEIILEDNAHKAFSKADAIINTLPYTPETHHFFGREAFSNMRKGAVFINVGRGGTVEETALVDALKNRVIRAASLDVFETEPLPPDAPIRSCDNVIITNHIAGISPHFSRRVNEMAVDNLMRYTGGEPLRNRVDKGFGY